MKINYDEGSGNTQTSEGGNSVQIQIGFKKVAFFILIGAAIFWLCL